MDGFRDTTREILHTDNRPEKGKCVRPVSDFHVPRTQSSRGYSLNLEENISP